LPGIGENAKNAVLTAEAVLAIRDAHIDGATIHDLALKYGAQDTTIRRVLEGKSWVRVTGGSNVLRRSRYGAYRPARPSLTIKQVRALRTYARLYPTIRQDAWARLLGVSLTAINDILTGWTYKDGGDDGRL
jgi:hypothetical protein